MASTSRDEQSCGDKVTLLEGSEEDEEDDDDVRTYVDMCLQGVPIIVNMEGLVCLQALLHHICLYMFGSVPCSHTLRFKSSANV